jgi:NAD(P)-dependent dehydrogenase (short-subunit alcohol dehydrogenase family)
MTEKIAFVAGANRGIGLCVVNQFIKQGWSVIATARRPDQATALKNLAASHPGHLTIAKLEMNDPAEMDALLASFASGPLAAKTLDIVLINAGISGPEHRSANQATESEVGALMMTNAIAPIRLARGLAPYICTGSGVLGFTSSVMGSVAQNAGGHELYRASKAALNSLTRGLAAELRSKNVTILSLHPGWVRTDMGGQAAPVSVEESAEGLVNVMVQAQGKHGHRFVDYKGESLAW